MLLFASSRVDADAEQYEQEFEYPQEDRVCASTSELTGEPTSFTYFTVLFPLLSFYPYVAFLIESRVLFQCYPYEPCYLSATYRRCLLVEPCKS
jgi:hypothetical protein